MREIKVYLDGPKVGEWCVHHPDHNFAGAGLALVGGGPTYVCPMIGGRSHPRLRWLEGRAEFAVFPDDGEFENNFEAAQLALELLGQLPDAHLFAKASLSIEVRER